MAAHFISRPVVPASEKFVFVYICVIAESRRIHKIYPDLIITDRHGVVTTVPFVAVIVAAFTVSRLKAAYHRMSAVYGLTELCYGDILTLLCTYSLKFPAKTEPPSVFIKMRPCSNQMSLIVSMSVSLRDILSILE